MPCATELNIVIQMPQIGLRASEALVEAIDDDKGPEESRSEYIRRAIRLQIRENSPLDDVEDRLDRLEDRLNGHDDRLDQLEDRGLLDLL